jgi:hypothetical protein
VFCTNADVQRMAAQLSHADKTRRLRAVRNVGEMDSVQSQFHTRTVAALLLADPSLDVRTAAAKALANLRVCAYAVGGSLRGAQIA